MSAREAQVGPLKMFVSSYGKACSQLFWLYCQLRNLNDDDILLVDEFKDQVQIFEPSDERVENTLRFIKTAEVVEDGVVIKPKTILPPKDGWEVVYYKVGTKAHTARELFEFPAGKSWLTKFDLDQLLYLLSKYASLELQDRFVPLVEQFAKGEIEVEQLGQSLLFTAHNLHLWPTSLAPSFSVHALEIPDMPLRLLTSSRIRSFDVVRPKNARKP